MRNAWFLSILLLPVIILFDLLQYFLQRNSCLTCANIPQFVEQSSLAAHVISQSWASIRGSLKK